MVSEAAAFFRLLFTPCVLWMDEDEESRAKYNDMRGKCDPSNEEEWWRFDARARNWESFDNPKGEPDLSETMVSMEMLVKFDELNEMWEKDDGRLMFLEKPNINGYYWAAVQDILKTYVCDIETTSEEGQMIVDNILKKLHWYVTEGGTNMDLPHQVVPILTPRLLDALAAHITTMAPAYEEVSHFIFFFTAVEKCSTGLLTWFHF
jgi:hypothetical protein